MIHHKRGQADAIETRILRDGAVRFDPPASRPRSPRSSRRTELGVRRAYLVGTIGRANVSGLVRQLVGEDFGSLDLRRLGKQLRRLRRDLLCQFTLQMGLTAAFVGENVKDAKHPGPHPNREPGRCVRFVTHHGASAGQEVRDLLLLAGLGFELNVKRMLSHFALLSSAPCQINRPGLCLYDGEPTGL